MAERFHFEVIDARHSIDDMQKELRAKIAPLLEKKKKLEDVTEPQKSESA